MATKDIQSPFDQAKADAFAGRLLPALNHGDARIAAGEGEAVCEMHGHAPVSIRVYLTGRRDGGHQSEQ